MHFVLYELLVVLHNPIKVLLADDDLIQQNFKIWLPFHEKLHTHTPALEKIVL
jgi:hypothetical protein